MPRLRSRRDDDAGYDSLVNGWEDDQDPGRRRSPFAGKGWILAALLLALVVALAARLIFFGGGGGHDPGRPGTGNKPIAETGPCPTLDPVTKLPTSGKDNQWQSIGVTQAPISLTSDARIGPVHGGKGQPPSCFAPGPAGALFAAANFLADLTAPDLVGPAIRNLTAPSAGRDALVHILDTSPAELNATGATRYTFVGYTFQSNAEKQATVSLAIYTAKGALGQVNITVARDGNDWHIVPPPSGNFADVVHQITDLTGFTRWTSTGG